MGNMPLYIIANLHKNNSDAQQQRYSRKLPKLPMPNIRQKPINRKNFAEKMRKNRKKKAYTDGCRIIEGKIIFYTSPLFLEY